MPTLNGVATEIRRSGANVKYQMGQYFLKRCWIIEKVQDVYEREEMASILGHLLEVPIVRAWISSTNGITFLPGNQSGLIRDKCIVMDFLHGHTLLDDRAAAANWVRNHIRDVADIFAYMHWIGDEDRGLEDIMLVGDELVLVDNGLTGPPVFDSPLRGTHPMVDYFINNPKQILKKCFPGKPSFVAFVIRDLRISCEDLKNPGFIDRCVAMNSIDIRGIVEGLGMHPMIADVLDRRRRTLQDEYAEWIEMLRRETW